jgi:hypothetical protein
MSLKQLYIGINGFAGSGKDTVAKMLKIILGSNCSNLEECKQIYKSIYSNPLRSATFDPNNTQIDSDYPVMCIAYADQLKYICAGIFGIPVQRFYMNKGTAWICINKDFQYTEIKPEDHSIVTADEFYYGKLEYTNSDDKYWMSLREILVYVGTYVLQHDINKNIFVNIVYNKIKESVLNNPNLNYVIVTDNRFTHELDFIRKQNGITIQVVRDSVQQLDNIAEHDLDEQDEYDYIIENNGSYDELFEKIWNIVHNDIEFKNKTIDLCTRDEINNYLRLIATTENSNIYLLCTPMTIQNVYHIDGDISMINPTGGPIICIGEAIDGTKTNQNPIGLIPSKIEFHEESDKFLIYIDN